MKERKTAPEYPEPLPQAFIDLLERNHLIPPEGAPAHREADGDCRCAEPQGSCQGCIRHKHRDPEEAAALQRRLSRIEGQVRGIRGMVERDAYCTDILTQVSAVQSALSAFSRELLAAHVRTCVVEDIRRGDTAVVDELLTTLQKLMK